MPPRLEAPYSRGSGVGGRGGAQRSDPPESGFLAKGLAGSAPILLLRTLLSPSALTGRRLDSAQPPLCWGTSGIVPFLCTGVQCGGGGGGGELRDSPAASAQPSSGLPDSRALGGGAQAPVQTAAGGQEKGGLPEQGFRTGEPSSVPRQASKSQFCSSLSSPVICLSKEGRLVGATGVPPRPALGFQTLLMLTEGRGQEGDGEGLPPPLAPAGDPGPMAAPTRGLPSCRPRPSSRPLLVGDRGGVGEREWGRGKRGVSGILPARPGTAQGPVQDERRRGLFDLGMINPCSNLYPESLMRPCQ